MELNADDVRHWALYHQFPDALAVACRTMEADGFRLDRIVPYTDQQSVAVFVRVLHNDEVCPNCGRPIRPHESGVCRACAYGYQPEKPDPTQVSK